MPDTSRDGSLILGGLGFPASKPRWPFRFQVPLISGATEEATPFSKLAAKRVRTDSPRNMVPNLPAGKRQRAPGKAPGKNQLCSYCISHVAPAVQLENGHILQCSHLLQIGDNHCWGPNAPRPLHSLVTMQICAHQ